MMLTIEQLGWDENIAEVSFTPDILLKILLS